MRHVRGDVPGKAVPCPVPDRAANAVDGARRSISSAGSVLAVRISSRARAGPQRGQLATATAAGIRPHFTSGKPKLAPSAATISRTPRELEATAKV